MFNLIVNHSPWGEGRGLFPCSRIFEYTDKSLVERFKPEGQLDLAALTDLPTVFIEETYGEGDQIVKFGRIVGAHTSNEHIALEYFFDPGIQPVLNRDFQTFAAELEIKDFQFTRTHWSIKDVDLFRILLRNLQPRRSMPTAFKISDPEAINPLQVAAMMPFHPDFKCVYETLKKVAYSLGVSCSRADDIWENSTVIQDVVSLIDRSRVVICDCSTRNPNVFYEIGIAHALGREVILITQSANDIPFDLKHHRYVTYHNNEEGRTKLAETIHSRLESLLA